MVIEYVVCIMYCVYGTNTGTCTAETYHLQRTAVAGSVSASNNMHGSMTYYLYYSPGTWI